MKNVRLNNGVMMPAIGFGIFQIPENETERIVNDAIETGYRKFDTAASYFNEEQLGNAIRHSGMKREEFFITTKLWVQDYEYDDALRAFDLSMKKLGLDYPDLYLMHKPYGNYYAAWRAMERLFKESGLSVLQAFPTSACKTFSCITKSSRPSTSWKLIRCSSSRQPMPSYSKKASSMKHGHLLPKDKMIYSIILH